MGLEQLLRLAALTSAPLRKLLITDLCARVHGRIGDARQLIIIVGIRVIETVAIGVGSGPMAWPIGNFGLIGRMAVIDQ